MKKIVFLYLVAFLTFGSSVFISPASAAGMKIGVIGWYAWWNSGYLEMRGSGKSSPGTFDHSYTINSAPLYGPILSFDIGKWSLNTVFLCGDHFRIHSSYGSISLFGGALGYSVGRSRAFKYDLDSTLTYAFTKYFKAFLGFKYQGYQHNSYGGSVSTRSIEKSMGTWYEFQGYGPGAGIGVTIPLVRTLYLIWNGSALYSRTIAISRGSGIGAGDYSFTFMGIPSTSNFSWQRQNFKANLNGVGCNTSLTLAYLVPAASLTISLGVRYQFVRYFVSDLGVSTKAFVSLNSALFSVGYGLIQDKALQWGARRTMNGQDDHFYGLIFSVIYSIDFTRNNPGNG